MLTDMGVPAKEWDPECALEEEEFMNAILQYVDEDGNIL
jgi:hypothetical protein